LRAVLTRLFWTVVRNAQTWFEDRKLADEHWLRVRNTRNLTEELRRAVQDLNRAGEVPQPPPDAPVPAVPDARHSGYAWDSETDYQGRGTARPEEILELLDARCEGVSDKDVKVFKYWWASSQECTEKEEDVIAGRHGLTRGELNAIVRRVALLLD